MIKYSSEYDYGARHYDPALGRWHVQDPMQEKRIGLSPYCYTSNNPVNRIDPNGMYHYYLQDHQGNNRVVADRNGKVEEVNHYYPFGGMFATTGNIQPYKYNGKELDTRKGLNWYDYGARYYDPAVGRFTVVDSLAEKHYYASPYIYCNNLPMRYIDPDGNDWKDAYPHLKNAVSISFSAGLQFGFSAKLGKKSIGADINVASAKFTKDGLKYISGISLGIGPASIEISEEVYQLNDTHAVKEENTSLDIIGINMGENKTTIYDSTGQYFEKVSQKKENTAEIKASSSIYFLIGGEVSIKLNEMYNFITNLFK